MVITITLDDGTLVDIIRRTDEECRALVDDDHKNAAQRLVFVWELQDGLRRALRYKTPEEHAKEARRRAFARAVEGCDDSSS